MDRSSKGRLGEKIAKIYLLRNKYLIVNQNWTSRWSEIDFIAYDNAQLVFIEVKYKTSISCGYPHEEVGLRKLINIKRSIKSYFFINNISEDDARFDVITILKNENKYRLKHYKFVELPF